VLFSRHSSEQIKWQREYKVHVLKDVGGSIILVLELDLNLLYPWANEYSSSATTTLTPEILNITAHGLHVYEKVISS